MWKTFTNNNKNGNRTARPHMRGGIVREKWKRRSISFWNVRALCVCVVLHCILSTIHDEYGAVCWTNFDDPISPCILVYAKCVQRRYDRHCMNTILSMYWAMWIFARLCIICLYVSLCLSVRCILLRICVYVLCVFFLRACIFNNRTKFGPQDGWENISKTSNNNATTTKNIVRIAACTR